MSLEHSNDRGGLREGFRLGDSEGDRTVRPDLNRIESPGGKTRVEPRALEVLLALAERAGEVVPREELQDTVWGDAAITDHALTNYISELRRSLGDSTSEPRFIVTVPKRGYRLVAPVLPMEEGDRHGRRSRRVLVAAATVLLAVLTGVAVWWVRGPGRAAASPPEAVAVLPFENLHEGSGFDHLRLALPDEITTLLTHSPSLAVRPFEPDVPKDPAEAGGVLDAAHVVTGHYYVADDGDLNVTLEAVDVDRDRVLWQTRLAVPAGDLLSLRERLASHVRDGLLPALGAEAPTDGGTRPADPDAYDLYLRSLGVPRDPGPNLRGIEMLERVVALEPGFAPAWEALSLRYHRDGSYGHGGDAALARARTAAERALELDRGLLEAAQRLISLRTEAGDFRGAWREARELLRDRPASASAHFSLAYVYRFGGLLEESQRHCERAVELDPFYFGWRSCAFSYLAAGELGRVERFIELDADSYWAHLVMILLRMRQGDEADALLHAERLPADSPDRSFLVACLEGRRGAQLDGPAQRFAEIWRERRDPEPAYWIGSELVYCGRPEHGLSMLSHAVEGGFCSHPAVDLDPVWNGLRGEPAFEAIRRRAVACRERFEQMVEELS